MFGIEIFPPKNLSYAFWNWQGTQSGVKMEACMRTLYETVFDIWFKN